MTTPPPYDGPKSLDGTRYLPVFSQGRWAMVAILILILVPTAFHAKALLPEISLPVPSLNDDAVHYLLVKRGSEALAAGENPFDHWVPEVEFGFPWFFYYQHLPHLAVILLHRLLLKQVDLLTLFNLIRYLLLLGFPLTVYWSMRRLGFSRVAGAVSASAAMLISSSPAYGFDYTSYVWRGLGMYTQLWAMHLFLVALAFLNEVLQRGKGYVGAIVASSMLALSHLIYAYMIVVTALLLLLLGLNRANLRRRIPRLAIIGALGAAITSYFWLPLAFSLHYMNASPYLQQWKYDSFGARDILTRLLNGELLDSGRLPVLTVLLALGVASALLARTPPARLALALFLFWLVLFFGRATWGRFVDFLPMAKGLLFHRFVGGVHLGALLLIGLGGEWVWQQLGWLSGRWRAVAAGLVFLAVMVPALRERQEFYALNKQWMERTGRALEADEDARAILSALGDLPPGRVYAGLYGNWGKQLMFGDLHFFNLLTYHRIPIPGPPYPSFSLNADLTFHFNERNPAHYNLFNVRYLIAPSRLVMPEFLRRIKETPRYVLYRADTSGSAMFATVTDTKKIGSQSDLFARNLSWLTSGGPALERFIRYDYPAGGGQSGGGADTGGVSPSDRPGCPGGGKITEERALPGRIDLRVECREAATLVLKVTYHPNWRVTIDGREERTYMVSPSFIGVDVPAGLHQIRSEYRSPAYKTVLLLLGACTLLATICFRRRLGRLDAALPSGPLVAWRFTGRPAQRFLRSLATRPSGRRSQAVAHLLRLCCAFISTAALSLLAVRSIVRLEIWFDTFLYHIPFAALRGGLGIPYTMHDRMELFYAGFPPLPHFVQGMLWRVTGTVNATGVANYLAFCLFLVVCDVKLGARFWLVAMIALTAPLVLIHTTVSYVDLFANALLAMGISSLVRMYLFDQYEDRSLLVCGLLGLVAASWSKYQLAPLTAVFLVAFAVVYLRPSGKGVRKRSLSLCLVVIAIILAALPYLKNFAVHRNPFWPLRVPVASDWFPYALDSREMAMEQRPPSLAHFSQFKLFFHSLFEINHPTDHPHRSRWIIDQGRADIAFRMGGFWSISVTVYLLMTIFMALVLNWRKGIWVVGMGCLLICFLAALPQSHELRYYLFLPLCWSATIGMLFPQLQQRHGRAAFCCLLISAGLFLYMGRVNRTYYRLEGMNYRAAADLWGASRWWDKLKPGTLYCAVDMIPIGIMLTGPTMSEFSIIDRSNERLCPEHSVIITATGSLRPRTGT